MLFFNKKILLYNLIDYFILLKLGSLLIKLYQFILFIYFRGIHQVSRSSQIIKDKNLGTLLNFSSAHQYFLFQLETHLHSGKLGANGR